MTSLATHLGDRPSEDSESLQRSDTDSDGLTDADKWHLKSSQFIKQLAHNGLTRRSRITAEDIIPLPPLFDEQVGVPLFVLVLPMTAIDTFHFGHKHGLPVQRPRDPVDENKYNIYRLQQRMIQTLPRPYCRWARIYGNYRCIVLATNYTKQDLKLAFDLDMLERIRLLLGVSWYPIWALTDEVRESPFIDLPKYPLAELPPGVPSLPKLSWKTALAVCPTSWRDSLKIERLRKKGKFKLKYPTTQQDSTNNAESQ